MDATQFDRVAKAVGQGTARRRLLAGLLGATLAGSLGHDVVGAQGNSRNAKRCQKRGWESLARTEDPTTPFTSEEECVSYGAQGGTIVDVQVICVASGQPCDPDTDTCCQLPGSTTVCAFEVGCIGPPGNVEEGIVCCRQADQPCRGVCDCCGILTCRNGICA